MISLEKSNDIKNKTFEEKIKIIFNQNKDEELEQTIEKISKSIEFINYFEKKQKDTLLNVQKLWHDYFTEKEDILLAMDTMILYYRDILRNMLNKEVEIFNEYNNDIIIISKNNTINKICYKINVLNKYKEKTKYNMNTGLMIDKLIIELERG